jgi:RND family efflux transporter MFP subunit
MLKNTGQWWRIDCSHLYFANTKIVPAIQSVLIGANKSWKKASLLVGGLVFFSLSGIADNLWVTGVTHPYRETTLSAAVPGIIADLPLREGSVVAAGDVVVALRNEQEVIELKRRTLLYQNQAELEAAAARVATRMTEYQSTLQVYEATRSISREELDRKKLEYDLAQAEKQLAEMNKEREKLEKEMAAEALERRLVRTPISGVVASILIEVGEGCEVRQPLVVIVDTSQVIFQCNLEATHLALFHEGQSIDLEIENDAAWVKRRGIVTFVSPVVDRASGLGTLKAVFENTENPIWAGVGGRIRMPTSKETAAHE